MIPQIKRCSICFKEFAAKRPTTTTCSRECLNLLLSKKQAERRKMLRENRVNKTILDQFKNQSFRIYHKKQLIDTVINGDNENVIL